MNDRVTGYSPGDYAVPRLAIYRWPCTSTSRLDHHWRRQQQQQPQQRQQQIRGGLLRLQFGILRDRCGGKASCSRTKCEPFSSCGFSSCSCSMWPAADNAMNRPARPAKVPVAMRPLCLAPDSVSARPMQWIAPTVDWLKCRWICQRTPTRCKWSSSFHHRMCTYVSLFANFFLSYFTFSFSSWLVFLFF